MTNSKRDAADYATLFLARAILEGDLAKARAAVEAGADLGAFWIDGKTRLRDLPAGRHASSIAAYFKALTAPEATETLPVYRPPRKDPDEAKFWSRDFVLFAARRGYGFHAKTVTLSGMPGTYLPEFRSVKGAVSAIDSKWGRIESVSVLDRKLKDGQQGSEWTILFRATWDLNDHRKTGSRLVFVVDESGWSLLRRFRAADGLARISPADRMDPALDRQRVWEGRQIMEKMFDSNYAFEDVVSALAKGGSPFYAFHDKMVGELAEETPDIHALMKRVRELCAPELGFHHRLAPYLSKPVLRAMGAQGDLEQGVAQAKAPKKTLATGRSDTI